METEIAIIGAGPAGLIAAERLSASGHKVAVFDRMPSVARKFLMAGRGGLNLTHAEDWGQFLRRYNPLDARLESALQAFDSSAMRQWAEGLGQKTFIGSSGRVFPEAMKASPLLRAWLNRLAGQGVSFHLRHEMKGFAEDGALIFSTPDGEKRITPRATLLALGGASWPRLGSDGGWVNWLDAPITTLRAANCGVLIEWSEVMQRHAGTPLKRIIARVGKHEATGEAIITAGGLEGGVIYALSRATRFALERAAQKWDPVLRSQHATTEEAGPATLTLDLKPEFRPEWIAHRLSQARAKDSLSSKLRKAAGLQPNAVSLVFEAALALGVDKSDYAALANLIRALPLSIKGQAGLNRAISTAGGVRWEALDQHYMLRDRPGIFVAGEMLDWEAPTGGYLLQACFATGVAAAEGMAGYFACPLSSPA